MRKIGLYIVLLVAVACSWACRSSEPMPLEPDYSSEACWFTNVEEKPTDGVDVFYILPTCVFDWEDSTGVVYRYGDIYNNEHRASWEYSLKLAESIFGEKTNFYAPYYRQISLDVWIDGEAEVERLFPAAMKDIDEAFDNFIERKNNDRPFIIAGFSQGAKAVVELVKDLTSEELDRMIAAYVIGYKVTREDLRNPNIKGAKSADDTGVTICYNSVGRLDAINPMVADSELCINPVNWSTDATPVHFNDRVTVSNSHNVLIVEGLNSDSLYVPSLSQLFKRGNYHLQEMELYKDLLRRNIATRIDAFRVKSR